MATAKDATKAPTEAQEAPANTVVDGEATVTPRRFFTIPGRDPFDEIEWELRDALIPGKGAPAFEQRNVEFPKRPQVLPRSRDLREADDRSHRRHDRSLGS
jgi:hypothetical protein